MESIKFNLLEDPWIPCVLKTKEFKLLSIQETLFKANEIFEISSNNPLIEISLYRFLLAVLHRNFGPKDRTEWKAIYKEGKWNNTMLDQYFKKWHHKFELFNEPENRFYQIQVPDLTKKTPISKLNHALSTGNNAALFDHTWDSKPEAISAANAAQLLIAFQNYAVGGGANKPFNYSHAPLITGLVVLLKGKTLFETLMLNLIQYDQNKPFPKSPTHEDLPFWERNEKVLHEEKSGKYPYGYLDYLTWQSRRIWLIPIVENGIIKVKEVYLAQGEKVKEDWTQDPQKVYKRNQKNEIYSIKINPDKQVWRDIECLLNLNTSPKAMEWVSKLPEISRAKRYNMQLYGLFNDPSNPAKLICWNRSSIPLSLNYLDNQGLVNDIKSFVDKCEKVERALMKTLDSFGKEYLFPGGGNLSKSQQTEIKSFVRSLQIQVRYWNSLENLFYKCVEEIAVESDLAKRQICIDAWINNYVLKVARDILSNLKLNMRNDPRALKPLVPVMNIFHYKIRNSGVVLNNV